MERHLNRCIGRTFLSAKGRRIGVYRATGSARALSASSARDKCGAGCAKGSGDESSCAQTIQYESRSRDRLG